MLEFIKNSFNAGYISILGQVARYNVKGKKDLKLIITHFDTYPLVSSKVTSYLIFREAYKILSNNEHLTVAGLRKLIYLKSLLNYGLSDKLKEDFEFSESWGNYGFELPVYIFKVIPDSELPG